jgi:hypothetical protein
MPPLARRLLLPLAAALLAGEPFLTVSDITDTRSRRMRIWHLNRCCTRFTGSQPCKRRNGHIPTLTHEADRGDRAPSHSIVIKTATTLQRACKSLYFGRIRVLKRPLTPRVLSSTAAGAATGQLCGDFTNAPVLQASSGTADTRPSTVLGIAAGGAYVLDAPASGVGWVALPIDITSDIRIQLGPGTFILTTPTTTAQFPTVNAGELCIEVRDGGPWSERRVLRYGCTALVWSTKSSGVHHQRRRTIVEWALLHPARPPCKVISIVDAALNHFTDRGE